MKKKKTMTNEKPKMLFFPTPYYQKIIVEYIINWTAFVRNISSQTVRIFSRKC